MVGNTAQETFLEAGVSGTDYREYIRRCLALGLLTGALIALASSESVVASVLFVVAIAIYMFVPRLRRLKNSLVYERIPAIISPDILGFLFASFLFSIPFWARMEERYLWDDFGVLSHPSSLLAWPVGLVSATILLVGAKYASF